MQDDLADMMEDMNEIQEIMGRSYGYVGIDGFVVVSRCNSDLRFLWDASIGTDIDESELEAELEGLEDEWAEEAETTIEEAAPSYLAPSHELPAAPSGLLDRASARRTDEFGLPVRASPAS